MEVGDIVDLKRDWRTLGIDYGFGVITDMYEDDFGTTYCEVVWAGDRLWHEPYELEVISEVEKNKL